MIINYLNLKKVISRGDLVHSVAKLFIGLLIFVAGIYWYVAECLGMPGVAGILGAQPWTAFKIVFAGVFGCFLIFLGLIIAWIEYEDLKWEAREKKEKKKPAKPRSKAKRRRRK